MNTVCQGRFVTVVVRGRLDVTTAPLLSGALDAVYVRRPIRVGIDMAALTFLGPSATPTLVAARRRLAAHGAVLALRAPSRSAWRTLALSGLHRVFEIDESPLGIGA